MESRQSISKEQIGVKPQLGSSNLGQRITRQNAAAYPREKLASCGPANLSFC